MNARVSMYDGDPDRLSQSFDAVSEPLKELDGFSSAYFLVDREGGRGMSITLWESQEALEASVQRANEMREQATSEAEGSIESVENWEVTVTVE